MKERLELIANSIPGFKPFWDDDDSQLMIFSKSIMIEVHHPFPSRVLWVFCANHQDFDG
jgi:hypothetical protein